MGLVQVGVRSFSGVCLKPIACVGGPIDPCGCSTEGFVSVAFGNFSKKSLCTYEVCQALREASMTVMLYFSSSFCLTTSALEKERTDGFLLFGVPPPWSRPGRCRHRTC